MFFIVQRFKSSFVIKALIFSLPIMMQRLLTTSIGMIDTIMVGKIGGIAGLAIATQILLLMNNFNYGLNGGISIFVSQYFGKQDARMVKTLFWMQILLSLINAACFFLLLTIFEHKVLTFFTKDEAVINAAIEYIVIVKYSYFGVCLINALNATYRSIQKTTIPLVVAFIVMVINIIANYLFIDNYGIKGIALSTVIATYIGLVIFLGLSFITKPIFLTNESLVKVDKRILQNIYQTTIPILINEALFGFGMGIYTKAFASLGGIVLEGYKVASTIISFFFVTTIGLNAAVGSFLGESLGQHDFKTAQKQSHSFIKIAVSLSVLMGVIIIIFNKIIISLFGNIGDEVFVIAQMITLISIIRITMRLFMAVFLGAMRAGGDTKKVLYFDSGTMWLIGIPLVLISVYWLKIENPAIIYSLIQLEILIGLVLSFFRFRQGQWLQDKTKDNIEKQKN